MNRLLFLILIIFVRNIFGNEQDCQSCHQEIKTNCGQTCITCHIDTDAAYVPVKNHTPIVSNPSAEEWWDKKCSSCHQLQIEGFKNNLHYSSAGVISQTRFLLGKDSLLKSDLPNDHWKMLLQEGVTESADLSDLVENLLAKKCLQCHFASDNRNGATGMIRNSGCSACHVEFDQQTGQPKFGHSFQKKPNDTVCLTCHTSNYVGADYHGYFEHDYHNEYNTPVFSEPEFGAYQHRLAVDVHQQAGLKCNDCHEYEDIMGGEKRIYFEGQNATVSCERCHGGFTLSAENNSNLLRFNSRIVAHQGFHKNVTCSACHAQWSYQDYGLHLFLDESNNYTMWEDYLWQGDQQVTELLQEQIKFLEEQRKFAYSTNRLTGEKSTGLWYKGWTFRRWEDPILGINTRGEYSIIRPLFQYHITFVDSNDILWLDSVIPNRTDGKPGWNWDAYEPHTIGKEGRSCESCHGNPKAVGLGLRQHELDSVAHPLTIPSEPVLSGSRLLNSDEQKRLMQKSATYKRWRARLFRQQGIEKLLK